MASGTDKRKRTRQVLVRLTEEEFTAASDKADRAGYPLATLFRLAALGHPGPRARRRPPADHKALRQLLGQSGRIGNNLNQIARHLNAGGQAVLHEVQEAVTACLDIRKGILKALSMNVPEEAAPDDNQG
jgi:hypothetical protein